MSETLCMRTVCCKLALDARAATAVRDTAVAFNAAASYCATIAWEHDITN
jgi:hypothetical protein